MDNYLDEIRKFMEKLAIPGRDLHDLPTSDKTFPDGSNYRIEIAGVERASTMEAMITEAKKRNIIIHRAIATVGGSTYCDFQELKAMAQMAYEEKIEVIMTIGPRKAWDPGSKEASNPEGVGQGSRLRGSDNISYWLADMMRNVEAGFRGFLVYDEGILYIVNKMREEGFIPKETILTYCFFKLIVFRTFSMPTSPDNSEGDLQKYQQGPKLLVVRCHRTKWRKSNRNEPRYGGNKS